MFSASQRSAPRLSCESPAGPFGKPPVARRRPQDDERDDDPRWLDEPDPDFLDDEEPEPEPGDFWLEPDEE